jgi:hypothetical protein
MVAANIGSNLDGLKARLKEVQLARTAKQLRLLRKAKSKLKRNAIRKRGLAGQDELNLLRDKIAKLKIQRRQIKSKSSGLILRRKIRFRSCQLKRVGRQLKRYQREAANAERLRRKFGDDPDQTLEFSQNRIAQLDKQRTEVQLILAELQKVNKNKKEL